MAVIALEPSEQLSRALGEAVVRIWGRLPPNLQNRLFEEAVTSQDEKMRPRLAVYLHEKHPRTCELRIADRPFRACAALDSTATSELTLKSMIWCLSRKLFELSSATALADPLSPAQRSIWRSSCFSLPELLSCFSLGAKPGKSAEVRLTARAKATARCLSGVRPPGGLAGGGELDVGPPERAAEA